MLISKMAQVLAEIFIIIIIGYGIAKKGIAKEEHFNMISSIIIFITSPALIFYSMYTTYTPQMLSETVVIPLIGAAVPFLTYVASYLYSRIKSIPFDKKAAFFIIASFSNTTFLGIPVNMALFGQKSIMTVVLYDLGQTTLFWSFGVYLMSEEKHFQFKNLKKLLNAPIIALFISLLITLLRIRVPDFLVKCSQMLGNITVPLAMMFIGMNMAYINIKEEKDYGAVAAASTIKLILSPLIAYLIVKFINIPADIKEIVILEAALPTMLSSAIAAKQYGQDYKFDSIGVLATTLCCFLSIPFILYLLF